MNLIENMFYDMSHANVLAGFLFFAPSAQPCPRLGITSNHLAMPKRFWKYVYMAGILFSSGTNFFGTDVTFGMTHVKRARMHTLFVHTQIDF
jgi:hypothetical protein